MAWKEEHIHVHVHSDNSQIICLLTEIRDAVKGSSSNELEKQMDSWLASLDKKIVEIETVSKQVDSSIK